MSSWPCWGACRPRRRERSREGGKVLPTGVLTEGSSPLPPSIQGAHVTLLCSRHSNCRSAPHFTLRGRQLQETAGPAAPWGPGLQAERQPPPYLQEAPSRLPQPDTAGSSSARCLPVLRSPLRPLESPCSDAPTSQGPVLPGLTATDSQAGLHAEQAEGAPVGHLVTRTMLLSPVPLSPLQKTLFTGIGARSRGPRLWDGGCLGKTPPLPLRCPRVSSPGSPVTPWGSGPRQESLGTPLNVFYISLHGSPWSDRPHLVLWRNMTSLKGPREGTGPTRQPGCAGGSLSVPGRRAEDLGCAVPVSL